MPLEIEPRGAHARSAAHAQAGVTIGLLNNMPDSALEATEQQFGALLRAAAGPRTVRLRFSSLPELARGPEARTRMDAGYWALDELLADRPDALIVTGSEPRTHALEAEPYWGRLERLIGWAETHTASTIWSCLAAHAVAQALRGVRRRRLAEKRFGVYEHRILRPRPLLAGVHAPLLTPHSRWNELPVGELESAGFEVLSASQESGADLFVRASHSLIVCFQGHPEYENLTLLKEYRRDVGRYLRGEQPAWPALPDGYFSSGALALIAAFRARAEAARDPQLLTDFPMGALAAGLDARWQPGAVGIYRNWLEYVAAAKERTRRPVASGV
jgi:homoserine O-succinyltransferase/O-acetyltransferase